MDNELDAEVNLYNNGPAVNENGFATDEAQKLGLTKEIVTPNYTHDMALKGAAPFRFLQEKDYFY